MAAKLSVAGPPQDAKAPSGGSAVHEVTSVGATYVGRFAPSPTGPLHRGSLVAALASWLDARAQGGRWLVRIEDVDMPRCVPGAADIILQQLADLSLVADEAPVWQSQRSPLYQQSLDTLIATGLAYPCACSRKEIESALTAQGTGRQRHAELVYPGTCRRGLAGQPARSWRFLTISKEKVPGVQHWSGSPAIDSIAPLVRWQDRRLGPQQQDVAAEVGDFVLKRADGLWAYQLAVVVDDAAQAITHVVRGEDLADNTARQLLLQRALGLPAPQYLHTPLVFGADGEKLSKQNGATVLQTSDPLGALNQAAQPLGLPMQQGTVADALAHWVACWRDFYNRPGD